MKKLYILMFTLIAWNSATAQNCLPEGITFSTQSQIDSFQVNYPGCTEIEGDVQIGEPYASTDITNLNGLIVLNAIGDSLFIINNPLTSLSGLENLNYIGGSLVIGHLFWGCQGNNALVNLTGLNGLDSIGGDLDIDCNQGLTSLIGLENLNFIGGTLKIGNAVYLGSGGNPSLNNLSGLDNLTSIGGNIAISKNGALNSLTGLEGLTSLQGGIGISDSPGLINLTGLDNLNYIGGGLALYENEFLVSLSGLDNIDSIAGNLQIGNCFLGGTQPIYGNEALASLNALGNITKIGGGINIGQNKSLTSLTGLDHIESGSITFLGIGYNDSLSTCETQSICDYLASPNGTIEIHDNAPGCNSQEEVEAACGVGVPELCGQRSAVSSYPNPFSLVTTIEYELEEAGPVTMKIFNNIGQEVAMLLNEQQSKGMHQVQWDAGGLPAGIYFIQKCEIRNTKSEMGKVVKY